MQGLRDGVCELCDRESIDISEHHLIPKTTHTNRRVRRLFSREEMTQRKVDMCQPCHKTVHTFFSEKELALVFNTLEALKSDPRIQKYLAWVRGRGANLRLKGRRYRQKEKQW